MLAAMVVALVIAWFVNKEPGTGSIVDDAKKFIATLTGPAKAPKVEAPAAEETAEAEAAAEETPEEAPVEEISVEAEENE